MFSKATKFGTKVRCAIFGPSGSGKSFTALRMATGIGGKIAGICTERMSMRKYSDRFDFDVCDLTDRSPDGYLAAIKQARGYNVLIIDTLSHEWQEMLEENEATARTKFRGNTWSAWSETSSRQRDFMDELLGIPCHLIVTMRSKTEWQSVIDNGKVKPVRIGLTPEQGKGIEYEFDQLIELSQEHTATIIKDRSGKYQDRVIDLIDEDFGRELVAWLADGEAPPAPIKTTPRPATSPDGTPAKPVKKF